jgi:hypothetical protein
MTDAAYGQTWAQLLDAEHALRALAEAQLREYVNVLEQLALSLAPAEVDARRRDDPACFKRLTAPEWLAFFAAVTRRPQPAGAGWALESPEPAAAPGDHEELTRLHRDLAVVQAENNRLRDLTQQLRQEKTALAAALKEKERAERTAAPGARTRSASASARATEADPAGPAEPQEAGRPGAPSGGAAPPAQAGLPPLPAKYARLFDNWPVQGQALVIMATTGWSLRQAVMRRLAEQLGVNERDKSLRVLFTTLEERKLVQQRSEAVDGTVGAGAADGQVRIAIVRLGEPAGRVLAELGLRPEASEWERLEAREGPDQVKRIAWICAFADHARQRGYAAEVCPDAARPAQPDLLLTRGDERAYVFVRGVEPAISWAELADGDDAVALGAPARQARSDLVAAARAGGIAHGRATDLEFLLAGGDQRAFWAETW